MKTGVQETLPFHPVLGGHCAGFWRHLILLLDAAAQHLFKGLKVGCGIIVPVVLLGGSWLGLNSRLDDGSKQALRLRCLPGCQLLAACSLLHLGHGAIGCAPLEAHTDHMSCTPLQ